MHLVAFVILFIIGSINAAFHKDYSGIEAIGKFILFVEIIAQMHGAPSMKIVIML